MKKKNSYLALSVLAAVGVLGGCANHQPVHTVTPPPVSGYNFGYKIVQQSKGTKIAVNVVDGQGKTWFTFPRGIRLLQANGDGQPAHLHRQGVYWVANGVASTWELFTNVGPVEAIAPGSVGVMLAAQKQHQYEKPRYVWVQKTIEIPFDSGSTLDKTALSRLNALRNQLNNAKQIAWIRVSGETSQSGSSLQNARIGANRSSVVSGWLNSQGFSNVDNLGWSPAGDAKEAMVMVRFQKRLICVKPPKWLESEKNAQKRAKKMEAAKIARKAEKSHKKAGVKTQADKKMSVVSTKKTLIHEKPVKKKLFVITTEKNILLSSSLQNFMNHQGWAMVWKDPDDYLVQYPARYTGKTMGAVLHQLLSTYHLNVVLDQGNHVAIINKEAGNNE